MIVYDQGRLIQILNQVAIIKEIKNLVEGMNLVQVHPRTVLLPLKLKEKLDLPNHVNLFRQRNL